MKQTIQEEVVEEGVADLWGPSSMWHLGRIYNTWESVAQAVSNGFDAGGNVWVVIEPKRVLIIDNGHGMVPKIHPDDQQIIEEYKRSVKAGKVVEEYDIRDHISPISKKSLQWMIEQIGLSARKGEKDVAALRGIGSIAFYRYGDKARIISRPSLILARDYWGETVREDAIPTHQLTPPTTEQLLKRNSMNRRIDPSGEPPKNPWGKPLACGTCVEVTDIRSEEYSNLVPGDLANYFKKRFAARLREGRELVITDRVTKEGMATRGGKDIYVKPPVYKGELLIDEDLMIKPRGQKFHVTLFFNPNSTNLSPVIELKEGSPNYRLVSLREFADRAPWNSGHLDGWVKFPTDFPNYDRLVDTSKTQLVDSPERSRWAKALIELGPRLQKAIKIAEERRREQTFDDLAEDVALATSTALSNLEAFRERPITGWGPSKRRKKTETVTLPPPPSSPPYVIATVFSEHNRGVPGVTIELWQKSKKTGMYEVIDTRETRPSGSVSFGRYPFGMDYCLKLIVPSGMSPVEDTEQEFDLYKGHEGFRGIFRIHTGATKPPEGNITRIIPWFHPFEDDPDEPYRQRLGTGGQIEYNTIHPYMRRALDESDKALLRALLTEDTTAAIIEHRFPEGERGERSAPLPYILRQKANLSAELWLNLLHVMSERERKVTAAKRRRAM